MKKTIVRESFEELSSILQKYASGAYLDDECDEMTADADAVKCMFYPVLLEKKNTPAYDDIMAFLKKYNEISRLQMMRALSFISKTPDGKSVVGFSYFDYSRIVGYEYVNAPELAGMINVLNRRAECAVGHYMLKHNMRCVDFTALNENEDPDFRPIPCTCNDASKQAYIYRIYIDFNVGVLTPTIKATTSFEKFSFGSADLFPNVDVRMDAITYLRIYSRLISINAKKEEKECNKKTMEDVKKKIENSDGNIDEFKKLCAECTKLFNEISEIIVKIK